MTDISRLRAGVEVTGVAGSSPGRATAKGIAPVHCSLEEPLADGHRANVLDDAIAASNAEHGWVNVPTTEVTG